MSILKYKLVSLLVALLSGLFITGQSRTTSEKQSAQIIGKTPNETVYIHTNASLFFSGERILYKFYCFDGATKKLSKISKVGYVKLINEEKIIFHHKIILNEGVGYSDFFIPTSVPTGSYKVLGYSYGMQNSGLDTFFQSDIQIINPYQKLPKAQTYYENDSLISMNSLGNEVTSTILQEKENDVFTLRVDKPHVATREKVELNILLSDERMMHGNYSLSVRKKETLFPVDRISSETFSRSITKRVDAQSHANEFMGFLPELRGELLSGVVRNKKTGLPKRNQRVSLSLPGEAFVHKIAATNDRGEFHFNITEHYTNENGVIQVMSDDWSEYEVILNTDHINHDGLVFEEGPKISKKSEDYILERSIQNQLGNAYQEVRLDSISSFHGDAPFYRNLEKVYDLDDYTRFNSIRETIVEVIDNVSTRKLSNGDRVFEIRPEIGLPNPSLLPMVFVDGLFIKRHQDIMSLSARKIKSIGFSKKTVVLGPQTFQGILVIKTIEGDFFETFYAPHLIKTNLFKPQTRKKYFVEEYTSERKKKHIPDFRRQLVWLPNLTINEKSTDVSFFSSDITGEFEVVLDGFSMSGRPITIKKSIVVK